MFKNAIALFKSNPALIISIISLFLSIYNFLYLLIVRHKKLGIEILKYRFVRMNGHNIYQFQCIITNKSQLPISISNISINDIYCKFDPTRISDSVSTIVFPIVLNSLEAQSGWLEFKTLNEIDVTSMFFNCYTSRGLVDNIVPNTQNIIDDSRYHNND